MDSLPAKVMEHDAKIKGVEQRVKSLENEVHDLRDLTKALAVTNENVTHLSNQVDELHQDVKAIKEVPANRWNSIVTAIVTGVIGTLVGAILTLVIK